MIAKPIKQERRGGWNRGKKYSLKKPKIIFTKTRVLLRSAYWNELRRLLQKHLALSSRGEALRISKFLEVRPSQIHRWTCPICEHDTEPNFSQGFALYQYLLAQSLQPDSQAHPLYYPFQNS